MYAQFHHREDWPGYQHNRDGYTGEEFIVLRAAALFWFMKWIGKIGNPFTSDYSLFLFSLVFVLSRLMVFLDRWCNPLGANGSRPWELWNSTRYRVPRYLSGNVRFPCQSTVPVFGSLFRIINVWICLKTIWVQLKFLRFKVGEVLVQNEALTWRVQLVC